MGCCTYTGQSYILTISSNVIGMQLGPGRCGGPFVLSRDIMNSLFSVDGPLMRAMSDLLTLLKLNFLTLLCCLPVFTAGAAVTALHYCIMKMLDGK